MESYEQERLHEIPTRDLLGHAMTEAKLVAKAEVLHARAELRTEVKKLRMAAVLLVPALVFALTGFVLGMALIAHALPLPPVASLAIVGGFCLLAAAGLGAMGFFRLPKKPMKETVRRLERYIEITREELI